MVNLTRHFQVISKRLNFPRLFQAQDKMDNLIEPYGIDFAKFKSIITSTGAIVAGSFALAGYLKQEGIEPGYEPGDIDIFVYDKVSGCGSERCDRCRDLISTKNSKDIIQLLIEHDFKDSGKFSDLTDMNDSYYGSMNAINKVYSYVNESGKEVQIVSISRENVLKHIQTDFDLSICVSWWDSNHNTFMTYDGAKTCKKQMYCTHDIAEDKTLTRIEKYKSRGFTLGDKPCPHKSARDERDRLDVFGDLEASDIILLDEVKIKEYLAASDWNMVLKIKEKYYAFDRRHLFKTMQNNLIHAKDYIEDFFETPLKHAVTKYVLDLIPYSDYSIFELISPINIKYGYNNKNSCNVYTAKCYTIKDWADNKVSKIIMPKKILDDPLLNQIQESFINTMMEQINIIQPQNISEFQSMLISLESQL